MRTAATRLAQGAGQDEMPARFPTRRSPSWVCGCATAPEGLGFSASCRGSASAMHAALLSLLALVFWGQLWGDTGRERCWCPELPAPSSLPAPLAVLLN